MPSGLGLTPCGVGAYGFGTPDGSPDLSGKIQYDSDTALKTGARKIDPKTGTYEFDETNGRVKGMSAVQQMVQLAITTQKGSCADENLGNEFYKIRDIDESTPIFAKSLVESCLAYLIKRKWIKLSQVDVQNLPSSVPGQDKGVYILIKWIDLTDPSKPEYNERAPL